MAPRPCSFRCGLVRTATGGVRFDDKTQRGLLTADACKES